MLKKRIRKGGLAVRNNHIRILCAVLKVDLVYEAQNGELTAFFDTIQDSPLMRSRELRQQLCEGATGQSMPFLCKGNYGCFFAALRSDEGYLYMGPMCSIKLGAAHRRQMARSYGITENDLRVLPVFTLPEIRNMILLTNSLLENVSLENEELLQLNRIINQNERLIKREQTHFLLREEEENDEAVYRHTYHEEQLLMQAIREGRTADAVRLSESMDRDSGRLADDELQHRRNLAIVGIALCARAAVDGGVSPEASYRISGYYIRKCNATQDLAHMFHYRNRAIEELSGRVAEQFNKPRGSNYVERCKDYIHKHYREKIYLDTIADSLKISPSYLSKLFHQQTGMCLQDYINEERGACGAGGGRCRVLSEGVQTQA